MYRSLVPPIKYGVKTKFIFLEAVNIGRILALCLEQEETVDSIIKSTSIHKKLQQNLPSSPPVPGGNGPSVRAANLSPSEAAAQTAEAESEPAVNPTNAILLVPVLVGVLTGFTYFWCWWRHSLKYHFSTIL